MQQIFIDVDIALLYIENTQCNKKMQEVLKHFQQKRSATSLRLDYRSYIPVQILDVS